MHVVGYAKSVNKIVTLDELKKKLFTIKSMPNAIPYVTNYYGKRDWGFCIEYKKFKKLKKENIKFL